MIIRSIGLCGGLLLSGLVAASAAAQGAPAPGATAPPNPIAASTTAGWTCQDGRCTYHKVQGAWSDCFTSWSPTHGGWLPTRYCR